MSTSTKPYLLRALYEWCLDNHYTPHISVWVDAHTQVPMAYVKEGQIVLNIGASACQALKIDNDYVSFSARFSGVAHEIWIPVGNVIGLFSRETGDGMGFEVSVLEEGAAPPAPATATKPEPAVVVEPPPKPPVNRGHLRVVK